MPLDDVAEGDGTGSGVSVGTGVGVPSATEAVTVGFPTKGVKVAVADPLCDISSFVGVALGATADGLGGMSPGVSLAEGSVGLGL